MGTTSALGNYKVHAYLITTNMIRDRFGVEFNSDGWAGYVQFRSIPTMTPPAPGGSYVGGVVVKGVSKDSIFNEDFGNVFKSALGAVR